MPTSHHRHRQQQKQTLEITIAPGGAIAIEASGFKGSDCEQATRDLEQALGIVRQRTRKPEFYQKAANQTHQSNQQTQGT
ncbi:DUF2997 domain-containing protein [Phragmitibacter flavus]|uniref:DUF2997 domain-containing protein n=1 Tax=Phragmitibacter flavus TaxID=2576071 RepID=A0A5R8KHC1_9BACT|nr:DUF2997 domain-containing protein [Phragmitibacter flavus]TLD71667.1 DUF2997 domain-containing protein [Phragmitibacter flavus]